MPHSRSPCGQPGSNASTVTERARKLRAQYNLQAQGLRTRIEIRVNRIPMALRRAKMGELENKYSTGQHPEQKKPAPAFSVSHLSRPPPVPEKDGPLKGLPSISAAPSTTTSSRPGPGRPPKRTRFEPTLPWPTCIYANSLSNDISGDGKENSGVTTESEAPKKKPRGNPALGAETANVSKVLSPASANIQPMTRPTLGGKPFLTRPAPAPENAPGPSRSPVKQSSTSNLFSNWAEKARSTRKDAGAKRGNTSTSTTASSATGKARGRKPGTASTTGTTKEAATANARRASGISESSESSTSTVVKKSTSKTAEKAVAPVPAKRAGVIGTLKRGVTGGTRKTATTKASKATPASTATGRVLRKRKN